MRVAVGIGLLIASFALGAHASTSPLTQSVPPAKGFGRLKGFVLDRGWARIPAAIIVIEAENFGKESGYTEDGSYQVDLPAGSYRVTVRSDGFYPLRGGEGARQCRYDQDAQFQTQRCAPRRAVR